jgi:3-oxoacyl-[acyl-carrier protein] reductase
MNLNNARILITGGSKGIGKATAKLLAEHGAKVIITGRSTESIQAAAKEINAIPVTADLNNEADRDATFKAVQDQLGGLDVLVNNAGIGEFDTISDLTLEQFERVFQTNVFSTALITQKAVELFKAQNSGNIINIASTAATKGFERGTIYAASKFALRGMTQCWQAELRKHNIRVMEINPSEVSTAFGSKEGIERPEEPNKLRGTEIAHAIKAVLEMDDRGFIPELTVFATNPWS